MKRIDRPTKLTLEDQEFEDVLSAVGWTADKYPSKGALSFKAALRKLLKKLWKLKRKQK